MMASDQSLRDDAPATTARDDDRREAAAGREAEDSIIGRTVTINRPRNEIYDFWRDFGNLAAVMENVERIDTLDPRRSHWVVKAPAGRTVEWDSIVTEDEPGRLIAWQSVGGVRRRRARAGSSSSTRRRAAARWCAPPSLMMPPAGAIGEWIAKLFQREPNVQARRDLRRLKQLLETGEIIELRRPVRAAASESPTEQAL